MLRIISLIIFLGLIMIRPFICSLAFPALDMLNCWGLILSSLLLIKTSGKLPEFFNPQLIIRILIFLILLILSVCLSQNINISLLRLFHYLAMILCFLAVYLMTEAESRVFIFSLLLSASFVSLNAIIWVYSGASKLLEILSEKQISWIFAEEMLSRNRAFLPFLMPATLGGYLIMHIPLSIAFYKQHYADRDVQLWKRPPQNSLLLCMILLMLGALLLTKAIGPVISLLLGFILTLFLFKSTVKKNLKAIICFLSAILFMLVFVRSYNVSYWRQPIFSLVQRQLYWSNTWAVIWQHPFLGTGPGNMPFVGSRFSHNSYLQLWAESGLGALLGFLNIIFFVFTKILDKKVFSQPLALWLWVSVLGFLIHNLIDFTFFLPETAIIWWAILALCCRQKTTDNNIKDIT